MQAPADQRSGGLVGWFIDNPVAANLLMMVIIVGGVIIAGSIRAQILPTVQPSAVTVEVPYPGATPAEVELGITRRIEEAIIGIEGVKRVVSSAKENVGIVQVELNEFADPVLVKDDVETAVDRLTNFPPANAERAIVSVPDVRNPVITLAILGAVPEEGLRKAAEQLERHLLNQPGISVVSLVGARDYEISIEVSEETLRQYGLSFDEVAGAVRASSIDLAGGSIITDGGEILLRTNQERQTGAAFETIVVRTDTSGAQVLLSDVATVRDGFSREQLINTYNNRSAIFVDVSAAEAEGTLAVKAAVKAAIENYDPGADIELVEFKDQSFILDERLSLLVRNALFGFALVFLFLVLMLDLKLAVWVSVGIVVAFLGGFIFFGALGVSLNMVSTFALVIVLGLVVDDAVVIGENIDAERLAGKTGSQAATDGVRGVMAPVMVGVTTTILAFAPLLLLGGVFGDVMRSVPIVVISVLVVSLVEAFFILPSHLGHAGTWSRGVLAKVQRRVARRVLWYADTVVRPAVGFAAKWRYASLGAAIAFSLFSVNLVSNGIVKFIFVPVIESDEISATISLSEGSPFEQTKAGTRQLVDAIARLSDRVRDEDGEELILSIVTTVGGSTGLQIGPDGADSFVAQENVGQVRLELTPNGMRTMSAAEIERAWRDEVGQIDGLEQLSFEDGAPVFGADIGFDLAHEDEDSLIEATEAMKRAIARIEGANQIKDSFVEGKRQLVFELTPAGLAAGLKPADVARQVRQAFFGEEVQRIQSGRSEVKVYVRYPDTARRSLMALDEFRVRLPDGASVPLSTVARAEESRAYSVIERVDGRRVVSIEASVDPTKNTPGYANAQLLSDVIPKLVNEFPGLVVTQASEARERGEDLAAMGQAFFVVLIAIFAIVATQLRSYLQPLAIIISVPLAISGAIMGHWLMGYSLSFVSVFGMIALAGVAINASVVLLDLYNKQRALGDSATVAAANAAARRFRPILLTTLTTALGLAPLIMETSLQARFLIPMAISLGFGIVVSGFMVLFVTPALALIIEDLEALPGRLRGPVAGFLKARGLSWNDQA